MSLIEIDEAGFDRLARQAGLTVVDFRADWCAPCRRFDVEIAKVIPNHPTVTFASIDVEREVALASAARIASLPTLILIRDGWLVHRSSGMKTAAELDRLIKQVQGQQLPDTESPASSGRHFIGRLTGRRRPIRIAPLSEPKS